MISGTKVLIIYKSSKEVIDLKSGKTFSMAPLGRRTDGATGGLLDGLPVICGGSNDMIHSIAKDQSKFLGQSSGSQAPPSTPTTSGSCSRRPSLSSSNDSTSPEEALARRLSLISEDMKKFDLEAELDRQQQQSMKNRPQHPKICPTNRIRIRYGSGRFNRDPIIRSRSIEKVAL